MEKTTILIGGKAGQGPNILTQIIGEALVKKGYYVFYSREYESLIRGGHNYNTLTFSKEPIQSNESKINVLVALDENTLNIHKKDLKQKGIIISNPENNENMYFAGRLFSSLCLDFSTLEAELKRLKNFEENLKHAKKGFSEQKDKCNILHKELNKNIDIFQNGNQGIALGAISSGIDVYYAYPMTPATAVMSELASKQEEKNILVMELENEIAVMLATLGSASTGAKAMLGSSGGGFDLMTEGLSFAGISEIPVVCYLASRPGPGTGVATGTGQGDLQLARHCGHGEFFRLVLTPSNPVECQELVSQAFYFSQKYKIPAIVLSDKHLAESLFTTSAPVIQKSEKSTSLIRYNSYEKTNDGSATENPEQVKKNVEARQKKYQDVIKECTKFQQYKLHGKESKNLVISYGSPSGAILDAIKDLDCQFLQLLYIEPFPEIQQILKGKNLILVENNISGSLANVIAEKLQIKIEDKNKILRYDGKPFFHDELNQEIKKKLK